MADALAARVAELRVEARKAAARDLLLAAYEAGETLSPKQVEQRLADWPEPDEEQLQRRAAQELWAAADHAAVILQRTEEAIAAADHKLKVAQADVQGAEQAQKEAAKAREAAAKQLDKAKAAFEAIPDDRRVAPNLANVTAVNAQVAEGSGEVRG